jgi:hypothetical protein
MRLITVFGSNVFMYRSSGLLFSAALLYISTVAFQAKSHPTGLKGPMREVPAPTSAA